MVVRENLQLPSLFQVERPASDGIWRSRVHAKRSLAEVWAPLLSRVLEVRPVHADVWKPNDLRKELGTFGLDAAIWQSGE